MINSWEISMNKILHGGGTSRYQNFIYSNSLTMIEEGVNKGYKKFELDVQLNGTGDLILAHDLKMYSRYYFNDKMLNEYPPVSAALNGSGKLKYFRFSEVIEFLHENQCEVYFDIKADDYYKCLDKILEFDYCYEFYFQVFSIKQIDYIIKQYKSVKLFLNVNPYMDLLPTVDYLKSNNLAVSVDINDLYNKGSFLRKFAADILKKRYHFKIKPLILECIKNNIVVIAHTVNDKRSELYCLQMGINEVMSDYYD